MVATEAAIIELDTQDVQAALALSREAHWNQNDDDWLLFLTKGRVFGVRDDSDKLVATAALLPFGGGNAWISMVLVTAQSRRKGLATQLVQACLDAASDNGLIPWLDATADGAAVYGRMGFVTLTKLHRLRLAGSDGPAVNIGPGAGSIDDLVARDRATIGFDRSDLLRALAVRDGSHVVSSGNAVALVRDGRVARHIGPLFADDAASALAPVKSIVGAEPRSSHLLDASAAEETFVEDLVTSGWNLERSFLRMRFGGDDVESARVPFAVAGPEYG